MTTGPDEKGAFWRSPAGLTFGVFLAVGALFLVLEHGAHLLGAWPLLFLLLCGGMHFFMHRGHGGHGGHGSDGHENHSKHRKEIDDGR
jgi:fatty acid desaturase